MEENTKLFQCDCGSMEHHFVMSYWPDDEPQERFIYTHIYLFTYGNAFKRIWTAIKYVLGYKCKYGHWDEVLLDEGKVKELWEYLGEYLTKTARDNVNLKLESIKNKDSYSTPKDSQ